MPTRGNQTEILFFMIVQANSKMKPRIRPKIEKSLRLCGLQTLTTQAGKYLPIAEQCNMAGSRAFAAIVREKRIEVHCTWFLIFTFQDAINFARGQVEAGGQLLDINVDDSMHDSKSVMTMILNAMGSDPRISTVLLLFDYC